MIRLVSFRLAVLALALAACGAPHARSTAPAGRPTIPALYDRLGGVDVIDDVVKDLLEHVTKDARISARFTTTDLARLQRLLTDQICELTGGPCKYTGRSMSEMHASMGITDAELRAFIEDLRASLDRANVRKREEDELVEVLRRQYGAPPLLPPGP